MVAEYNGNLVTMPWTYGHSFGSISVMQEPTKVTANNHAGQLANLVRSERERQGLSVRGLAAAAGVDWSWLARLERGEYTTPDPRGLREVARALEIDVSDLYLAAGYQEGTNLPGFTPYLRAKYDLPDEAVQQLTAHFELLHEKYEQERHLKGGRRGRNNRKPS